MVIKNIQLYNVCCGKGFVNVSALRQKLLKEDIQTSFTNNKWTKEIELKYKITKEECKKDPIITVDNILFRLSQLEAVEFQLRSKPINDMVIK